MQSARYLLYQRAMVEQPTLGEPRGLGIASTAPHPNAARLFVDFPLSRIGADMLGKQIGEYPLYPGVYPAIKGMDKAKILPARSLSDAELKQWAETLRTRKVVASEFFFS